MKLPTSSSILIATLAISSSSSCLAAPAGPHFQDSEMSPYSSTNQASGMPSGTTGPSHSSFGGDQRKSTIEERSNIIVERVVDASHLAVRDAPSTSATVDALIKAVGELPMIGRLLQKAISSVTTPIPAGAQSLDSSGSSSTPDIDPADMTALQSAIQEVSRALNSSSLPGPLPSVAGPVQSGISGVTSGLPVPSAAALSDGDGTNSGAGSNNYASSGASGPTQAPTPAPSSGNPASPPMPENPPNTPSLPPSLLSGLPGGV